MEALGNPRAYPHDAGDIEVHQTHISVVFLAGEFAYKIKKPVDLGFLDYSSLDRRRHFCEEEVRLNRRLAPDVYLGVVPVVKEDDGLRFDIDTSEAPDPVEWAVRMKRLPAGLTLEALLEDDRIEPAHLERLAGHLADFHAQAARDERIASFGRFEVVAKNARDNFEQSRDQVGRTVHETVFERLSRYNEDALARHRERIEQRAAEGMPCDTHGDLRLDHVYYLEQSEQPVIVDCIEFSEAFRFADPVADMAFLAMDLRQAGRRPMSDVFTEAYFDATDDEAGRALRDFYIAYRAAVRGKVQGIKAVADEVPERERERAAAIARGHWLLALDTLAAPRQRPALVLIGGLPGTGKSTLARALSNEARFDVIRSDAVRKELAGLSPDQSGASDFGEGLYTREWSDRTYAACRERAGAALFEGGRVIVDASFHQEARRRAFIEAGIRHGTRVLFLECRVAPDVVRERLDQRSGDVSDADRGVYERMAEKWEDPAPATERLTATVDTGGAIETSVEQALAALREAGLY